MADIPGMTRAQTIFLRACAIDPIGLCGRRRPSATILRRWMRLPAFRQAMEEIREAMRFQADVHLSSAAAAAARALNARGMSQPPPHDDLRELVDVLKLVHARDRHKHAI